MIKKISKLLLALSLLCTSGMFTPKVAYANEIETRGSNFTYKYITNTFTKDKVTYTVKLKFSYLKTSSATIINYVKGAGVCTTDSPSVTCSIENESISGYSDSSSTADVLSVYFDIVKDKGTGFERTWRYLIQKKQNHQIAFGLTGCRN